MTYRGSEFKFIDRGYKESILLIPGWSTDPGIFEKLNIPFNYIFPQDISPLNFGKVFASYADVLGKPGLHLLGWSMGGFIAAKLVSEYPSVFKSVILVSVRPRYEEDAIDNIKGYIRKSRKAYLCKFYDGLFSKDEEEAKRWFRANLFERYLAEMTSRRLLEGLDYLSRTELNCLGLGRPGVTFVHGDADGIAPIEEVRAVCSRLPLAKLLSISGARHLPLFRKEFAAGLGF